MHVPTPTHRQRHSQASTHIYTPSYPCVCKHICVGTHICIGTHTDILIPTHTHTHTSFFLNVQTLQTFFFLNLQTLQTFFSWISPEINFHPERVFFFFKFRQDVLHSEGRRERERTWPLWTLVTAFKGKEEILGVVFKYHLSSSVYKAFHVSGSFLKTQKNSVNLISLAYSLWPHWFHPITGQEMSSQQRCIQLNWAGFSGWVKALFLNNCKIKCFPVFHLHQKKIK